MPLVSKFHRPLSALVLGAALLVPVLPTSAFAAPPTSGAASQASADGPVWRGDQTPPAVGVTRLLIATSETRTTYRPGDGKLTVSVKAIGSDGPIAGQLVTVHSGDYGSTKFPVDNLGEGVTDTDGVTNFVVSNSGYSWAAATRTAAGKSVKSEVVSVGNIYGAAYALNSYPSISYGRDNALVTGHFGGLLKRGRVELRTPDSDGLGGSELFGSAEIGADGDFTFTVPLEHGQSREAFFAVDDLKTESPGSWVTGAMDQFTISPNPREGAQAFKRVPQLTLETSGGSTPGQPVTLQAHLILTELDEAPEIPADRVPVRLSYTVDGQPRETVMTTDRNGRASLTVLSRTTVKAKAEAASFRLGMWTSDGASASATATVLRQTRVDTSSSVVDGRGRVTAQVLWADDSLPLETAQSLQLWAKAGSKWSLATKATTNAAGVAVFTPAPKEHTTYQVRYAGWYSNKLSGDAAPSVGKDVKVRAVAQVTVTAPAKAKKGAKVEVSGAVTPIGSNRIVTIKGNGTTLVKVKTNSKGKFSATIKLKHDTTLTASVASTKTLDGSTSSAVTVRLS